MIVIEHYRMDSANPEWLRELVAMEDEAELIVEPDAAPAMPLPEAA